MLGWILGVAGDLVNVCPTFPQGLPCASATYYLAQFNLLVVNYHQYYQLFSSNFVTDSIWDAAFNAFAVLILDRISDSSHFNATRYFAIFFFSATFGNILTLLAGPYYVSAGASGGIFGLYAAIFSFSWAEEKRIEKGTLAMFLIIFIASDLFGGVNWIAHVGGAIGGFIAGPLLYRMLEQKIHSFSQSTESSTATKLIMAAVLVALALATIWQFLIFV
jgi:membrane associated rhomboid family serine protease